MMDNIHKILEYNYPGIFEFDRYDEFEEDINNIHSLEVNEFKYELLKCEIEKAKKSFSWNLMLISHRIFNEIIKKLNYEFFKWTFYKLLRKPVPDEIKLSKYNPYSNDLIKVDKTYTGFIVVYLSSKGNYFFQEIADIIVSGFKELNYRVLLTDEYNAFITGVDYNIIVAPHEFFYITDQGKKCITNIPSNTIFINTEQVHTEWFKLFKNLIDETIHIWDINYNNYKYLNDLGYKSYYLQLGFTDVSKIKKVITNIPEIPMLNGDIKDDLKGDYSTVKYKDKPIDICFFGASTKRRVDFFEKHKELFSKYNCYIHLNDDIIKGPLNTPKDIKKLYFDNGIIQRSKILINIHRDEEKYFEWHRIVMLGIWNKALVITEDSDDSHSFVPGKHYIECELKNIPKKIDLYLSENISEAENIINAAYDHLANRCKIADNLQKLMEEINERQ